MQVVQKGGTPLLGSVPMSHKSSIANTQIASNQLIHQGNIDSHGIIGA